MHSKLHNLQPGIGPAEVCCLPREELMTCGLRVGRTHAHTHDALLRPERCMGVDPCALRAIVERSSTECAKFVSSSRKYYEVS